MKFLLISACKFFFFEFHYKNLRLAYRIIVNLSHKFGLQVMIANLFQPLFGFPGFSARITGFVFRTFAITIGSLIILFVTTCLLAIYPIAIFLSYRLLLSSPELLFALIITAFLGYSYRFLQYPVISIQNAKSDIELRLSGGSRERALFSKLLKKDYLKVYNDIKSEDAGKEYMLVSELSIVEIDKLFDQSLNSMKLELIINQLRNISKELDIKYLSDELLMCCLILNISGIEEYFESKNRNVTELTESLHYIHFLKTKKPNIWDDEYLLRPASGVDKGWATGYTAELNKYSTDFTKLALKGYMPSLIGREDVKKSAIEILSKPSKNNIMLIGDPGCGKTTFIKGLAKDIANGTNVRSLKFKRVVSLDIGGLTSGPTGELNTRLTKIIKEIDDSGNVIVFIDEIHNLSSTLNSDPNAVVAFSTLEPQLSSGKFQFIGATSRENYVKYIQPNEAFSRNFDLVEMREASELESIKIIENEIKDKWLYKSHKLTYPAIKKAVEFSDKYIGTRVLPDSAIELFNQAIAKSTDFNGGIVDSSLIAKVVSEDTGVPVSSVSETERDKLLKLESTLHDKVIGQNTAIKQIADAVKRSRVNVRDEKKPIASFLFAGPTGVGKTETAKALALSYYGSEDQILRFDMSEYQEIESIRRLIGSTTGEVGILTSSVREKPFSLILFDEIEKANSKILNLFLQVLDEGILTDAMGKKVSFSNTFIIMTSNVGALDIIKGIEAGKTFDEIQSLVLVSLKEHFPPEFLNRFTGVIPFNPLTGDEIIKITKIKLAKVAKNMEKQHIQVSFNDEVISKIASLGYSREWGARFLNRVIEEKVETVIADKMLKEELKNGDELSFTAELLK